MISPNDIRNRCTEIYELIASDKVPEATKRLMDFTRDFSNDKEFLKEAVIISQNYNSLTKYERMRTLNFEEIIQHRNQLIYSMLGLIDVVQDNLASKIEAS